MTLRERTDDMLSRYGEAVTFTAAGRILSRDRTTIYRMVSDGRLDDACAGTMVDVRSIARYLCAPKAGSERAGRAGSLARRPAAAHRRAAV